MIPKQAHRQSKTNAVHKSLVFGHLNISGKNLFVDYKRVLLLIDLSKF